MFAISARRRYQRHGTKSCSGRVVTSFLDLKVGQCKFECGSFLHTWIQHEHSPGVVLTHQHVYVDSISPILPSMLHGEARRSCVILRCMSPIGRL